MASPKSLLSRWFSREEPPPEPLTARERLRLEHRQRQLLREQRRIKKGMGDGCSTCVQSSPSRGQMRGAKVQTAITQELAAIDARLAIEERRERAAR